MINKIDYPATLLCDFYKTSHVQQYPLGTEKIYSTWTARTSRKDGIDKVVCFGLQGFIQDFLITYFNDNFFNRPLEEIVGEYTRVMHNALGIKDVVVQHIIELHELGYLPIQIKAVREGIEVPIKVPMLTIENTHPKFFWVTNFLETLMSCQLWQPMTSATISKNYRRILDEYALQTTGSTEGVAFQGHDFSMRGMSSLESAKTSGAGHLLNFCGTDTIPAILYLEKNYGVNIEKELVGSSIYATEHSVQCAYGEEDEILTYKRLINEIYPTGFVSIVSDTWDFWRVVTDYLPRLKSDIMSRNGRVVIRADSGNPVDIICGTAFVEDIDVESLEDLEHLAKDEAWDYFCDNNSEEEINFYYNLNGKIYKAHCTAEYTSERGGYTDNKYYILDDVDINIEEWELTPEEKGLIQCLWEIFGGTINELGYKVLDTHIGAIYGDAITVERCRAICEKLAAKGFASTNTIYGIGSFSFQYTTRDTFGFALKSTYAIVDGEERALFKNPKTDNGIKKSQKGLVYVSQNNNGDIVYVDGLNSEEYNKLDQKNNMLELVFKDGELIRKQTLKDIRNILSEQ